MADLKNGTSSYPTSVDSATLVADGVDTPSQGHFNGPATAVVNIETELGIGLKGALADLATRLNINMSTAGGFLYGAAFPVAPANTPHMFWRTDLNKLYHYDISLASYSEVATSVSLADYVSKTTGATISAVHQFNPTVAGAPFTLGANAANQRVTSFCADKLYDGTSARAASPTAAANTIPVRNATKDVIDRDGFNLFGFVESALGPDVTLASNTSGSITVAPGDYFLVVADAEIDGGGMPTYPYGHLSYSGGGITARFITTYSVVDYPLVSKSAAAMVGSAASILLVTVGSGAMTVTNAINYTGGSGLSFVNRIGVYRLKRL